METPTAVALSRRISSMEVVSASFARSLPMTLVPPETRRMTGLLPVGSTQFLKTPRVTKSASHQGSRGAMSLAGLFQAHAPGSSRDRSGETGIARS